MLISTRIALQLEATDSTLCPADGCRLELLKSNAAVPLTSCGLGFRRRRPVRFHLLCPPSPRFQQNTAGVVNITNSFALPFEEDDKDPKIWFLDHNYLENMFAMFKKVNGACPHMPTPLN
jgi:hypothetical protein